MKLNNCFPVLFVKNAIKSRDFYVNVLGLEEIANNGDLNFAFREGLAVWEIMPQNRIPEILGMDRITDSSLPPRMEIGFETEDIDTVYAELKTAGVSFLHEMNTELWGQRTVRFYDPDGHLIEVGEAMVIFVRRIYEEEGRDAEAAAKRMYIPVQALKHILQI